MKSSAVILKTRSTCVGWEAGRCCKVQTTCVHTIVVTQHLVSLQRATLCSCRNLKTLQIGPMKSYKKLSVGDILALTFQVAFAINTYKHLNSTWGNKYSAPGFTRLNMRIREAAAWHDLGCSTVVPIKFRFPKFCHLLFNGVSKK